MVRTYVATPPRVSVLVDTHSARRRLMTGPSPGTGSRARRGLEDVVRRMRADVRASLRLLPTDRRAGEEHHDDVGEVEEPQVDGQAGDRLGDQQSRAVRPSARPYIPPAGRRRVARTSRVYDQGEDRQPEANPTMPSSTRMPRLSRWEEMPNPRSHGIAGDHCWW